MNPFCLFCRHHKGPSQLVSGGSLRNSRSFTLPGANFNMAPIETVSRLPDVVEGSFWCLSTCLDVPSKSQIRSEDVRSPLHPLKGHLVHFRRFFKTFLLGVQDSNLVESDVFLLIISDSSRNLARGVLLDPLWGCSNYVSPLKMDLGFQTS